MFNRESSFEGSRTKNQYNCCVQSTCFFSGLGYRGSLRELWVHHLVARLGEKLCLCQQEPFFGDFFEAKICPADRLRHQAEGVMFCGMHRLVGKTGVFWKEIFAVALCCTWSLPVRTLSRKMVTQCSTGFVIESFKQSVVWPSARCSIRAMPGRFSSKQSTRDMRQRSADQHKTRQLCFGPIPSVTWFCDWYCSCAFGSRIWPLCGRNYSRRMTRIQAEISCILTTFCDIFQMRGVKKWHTQQWHQLDEIAKWGVTLADLKKGCQAHAKRWLNFPLTIPGFGLFWTWLDTVRMWNLGAFRTWAFLKIKWKCCSRVFNQLQADSQPAFVLCIEWFDWLALESNAMSRGLKDTLFLWDLDDMFVHNPAIFKLTWGNWYGLLSFSGQFFLICRRISRPALFCQARWPLLLPGHFSKTLGEEEAKAPAKAAWEIIEININRLAR